MPPTLATRKPIVKLNATDLCAFPVWEYAIGEEGDGEQDETWIRPVKTAAVPKGAYSQIAASDFFTSTGRKLQGFMVVTTVDGKVAIDAGAVVGRIGYRPLPCLSRELAARRKAAWDVALRAQFLKALRLPEKSVFPLRYVLRVSIRGEKAVRSGVLK